MKMTKFKILYKRNPVEVLEEYMTGKHGTLTEGQLQKIIDKKKGTAAEGHGAISFKYRKKVKCEKENR